MQIICRLAEYQCQVEKLYKKNFLLEVNRKTHKLNLEVLRECNLVDKWNKTIPI